MRHLLSIAMIVTFSLCNAQETGCFKVSNNNELTFATDIDFSRYNAFFLGEFHGVYGVSEVKLAFIKHLNRNYGITDVFMEISISAAWLYNRYLATGDTTFFTAPVLPYGLKKPNKDFWKELYEYNKGLKSKIVIHGIDFERTEFVKVLKLLMPAGKQKPKELLPVLNYIETTVVRNVSRDSITMLDSVYAHVRDDIEKNRDAYRQFYGTNFKLVEEIMFNENTYHKFGWRNKTMYQNIIKQVHEQKIKKFITMNGLNHGNMGVSGLGSLCELLMNNPDYVDKLVNIAMTCKNCYDVQLEPEYRDAAYRAPYTYERDTTLLHSIYERFYVPECKYRMIPAAFTGSNKAKRYSHYIILMKDQPEF